MTVFIFLCRQNVLLSTKDQLPVSSPLFWHSSSLILDFLHKAAAPTDRLPSLIQIASHQQLTNYFSPEPVPVRHGLKCMSGKQGQTDEAHREIISYTLEHRYLAIFRAVRHALIYLILRGALRVLALRSILSIYRFYCALHFFAPWFRLFSKGLHKIWDFSSVVKISIDYDH